MTEVYLLLGSNEGKRTENLARALKLIESHCGKVSKKSLIYETEAWGVKEQNSFLNQAIAIETELKPEKLLAELKSIETVVGRTTALKWGPRVIDIDILFYGNEIIDLPQLQIPHPFIQERRFTLVALNEIAAGFMHPVLKKTVSTLLNQCSDDSKVIAVS